MMARRSTDLENTKALTDMYTAIGNVGNVLKECQGGINEQTGAMDGLLKQYVEVSFLVKIQHVSSTVCTLTLPTNPLRFERQNNELTSKLLLVAEAAITIQSTQASTSRVR